MKKQIFSTMAITIFAFVMTSCQLKKPQSKDETQSSQSVKAVVTDGLRFCESTYPYQDGLLIASFGTEQLNPLNTEGKGYISFYKDGNVHTLISTDGNLSAPKGMFVRDNYLFICDVNKLVVYNLQARDEAPQIIHFPEGNLFVNDLAANGDTLYASVTNSNKIFALDISKPETVGTPVEWVNIPGPNGLIIDNDTMYVASYPADGNTTDANVIYQISGLSNPIPEKFVTTPGQYDGIALSKDKKTMYITNWSPAQIAAIDCQTKKIIPLNIQLTQPLVGPADITIVDEMLYIPDLPNSRVVTYSLNADKR